MEHQEHISEKSDVSPTAKLIAAIGILVMILAGGTYLIYGSGLWNPQVHHTWP